MHYADFEESLYNTTLFLQNTSTTLAVCTDVTENFYTYSKYQHDHVFKSKNDFLVGFFQNILANALRLESLSKNLTEPEED
jgi:hypothetical protein